MRLGAQCSCSGLTTLFGFEWKAKEELHFPCCAGKFVAASSSSGQTAELRFFSGMPVRLMRTSIVVQIQSFSQVAPRR
jgi:hypothetical protein